MHIDSVTSTRLLCRAVEATVVIVHFALQKAMGSRRFKQALLVSGDSSVADKIRLRLEIRVSVDPLRPEEDHTDNWRVYVSLNAIRIN